MQRIILHWTAGRHTPGSLEREHYHFIVAGDGSVVAGTLPPESNARIVSGRPYAAHTRGANTGSIGVAVAAMVGAVERPFKTGNHPITPAQVQALVRLVADLCRRYKIPVTRQTVLSHAEVQPTLGIAQRGKWDISWIPPMAAPGNPVEVGDRLRTLIQAELKNV